MNKMTILSISCLLSCTGQLWKDEKINFIKLLWNKQTKISI